MKKTTEVLLRLSLIPGIGPATIFKIFRSKNFDHITSCSKSDFIELFNLSEKIAQILNDGLKDELSLEEEIRLIEKYKVDLISIFDDKYPEILKDIFLPPPILYSKGACLVANTKKIAIVGSRRSKIYAKDVCANLIKGLVAYGWDTVSGGAIGVDAMVHRATLDVGGKTVVVLGSGLMRPYPSENTKLFKEVIDKGGTLISPFPLKAYPFPGNFPARNRIISGLSRGCLLVQAARKSGARITAQFALEQGKQVFAVPGSIFDDLSVGCHRLIAEGAKLVSSPQDILEEFGEGTNNLTLEKVKEIGSEEDPILECLRGVALSIDELSLKLNMDITDLQNRLFELQLEGKARQNFAGCWERV